MLNGLIEKYRRLDVAALLRKQKSKQIGVLYLSMVATLVLGVGVSIVNTRMLGPQLYGDFKFLTTMFSLASTIFTFGFFVSGGRLLTQRHLAAVKHSIIGSLFLLTGIISVFLIVIMYGFSFVQEQLFHNDLSALIRLVSPLLFALSFTLCLERTLEGEGRIYELSLFRIVAGPMLYLVIVLVMSLFVPLTLPAALALNLGTSAIGVLIFGSLSKPNLDDIKKYVGMIWNENKEYGFHVYIGTLAAVASAYMGGIFIGYYVDNTHVGFYSLADQVTAPLALIPTAVGTAFFRDFASRNSIPRRATIVTITLSLTSLLVLVLLIDKVIVLIYSKAFEPVVPLAYAIAIASILYGLGDYFNKFLGAHGQGRYRRNTSIVLGVSNIVGFIFLTKWFGVIGAVLTRIISGLLYLGQMLYYYKKLRQSLEKKGQPT